MRKRFLKVRLPLFLLFAGLLTTLLATSTLNQQTAKQITAFYKNELDSIKATGLLIEREALTFNDTRAAALFEKMRMHYKHVEALVEYHYPSSANKINGAPLLEAEPNQPNEPLHPEGFQVLEELVYAPLNDASRKDIQFEISNMLTATDKLIRFAGELQLTKSNVMDAIRLNLYRMMIKGITGFDNPVGLKGVEEAAVTLQSTKLMLAQFSGTANVQESCEKAISYIQKSDSNFDDFNRAVFISKYLNPLCVALYDYQEAEGIPFVQQSTAISVKAKHIFERNAFDVMHFAPDGTEALTEVQIALGKKLFFDPSFSSTGNRSCGSCHQPNKAFTDGLATNESILNGKKLMRNTPTLINAALQPAQFYDSRIYFLEDQAHDVISNTTEMGGTVDKLPSIFKKDKTYKKLFAAAYSDKKITSANIKKALAAYVRSLTKMDSPFDLYMRGDEHAMTTEQVKGFNLFAGKAKCATCHFIPLFSGAVAPLYKKIESEVLGVPSNTDTIHPIMDADKGKYNLYNIPHQMNAFKTTTVRNAAATAPYMHNGVYNTLEEVIDFYDKGGGAGLGFDLPNQTLSPDRLNLSASEKKELIAFIHALTDTTYLHKPVSNN